MKEEIKLEDVNKDLIIKLVLTVALVVLSNYIISEILRIEVVFYKPILIVMLVLFSFVVISFLNDMLSIFIKKREKKER